MECLFKIPYNFGGCAKDYRGEDVGRKNGKIAIKVKDNIYSTPNNLIYMENDVIFLDKKFVEFKNGNHKVG